jgi:pimeloyl-ACP methyl ester carboxylesterase
MDTIKIAEDINRHRRTMLIITPRQQTGHMIASDGCGHFLPEECPDELTEAVLKFWQSTPR